MERGIGRLFHCNARGPRTVIIFVLAVLFQLGERNRHAVVDVEGGDLLSVKPDDTAGRKHDHESGITDSVLSLPDLHIFEGTLDNPLAK